MPLADNDRLKFARLPAPRHAEDYKAARHGVTYRIWHANDNGGTFGLSISDNTDQRTAANYWSARYRGRGIVWLRTKRRCEAVANEIAELVAKDQPK